MVMERVLGQTAAWKPERGNWRMTILPDRAPSERIDLTASTVISSWEQRLPNPTTVRSRQPSTKPSGASVKASRLGGS